MVFRLVSLKCKPEGLDAFRLLLREFSPRVRAFPGCLSLRIVSSLEDPTHFYTLSTWCAESDLEAYRSSPLFAQIWPRIKSGLREPAWAETCRDLPLPGLPSVDLEDRGPLDRLVLDDDGD